MARFNNALLNVKPIWNAGSEWFLRHLTLNNSSTTIQWSFQAQEPDVITHLGFRYHRGSDFFAGGGAPPTFRISLRSPSADGTPDSVAITEQTFTPPADKSWDGTWQWIEMKSPFRVSRGEDLVAVIDYSSGTIGTNNYSIFTTRIGGSRFDQGAFPFGSEAGNRFSDQWVFGYKSQVRAYGIPAKNILGNSVNTPAQVALRIWMNPAFVDKFTIAGCRFTGRFTNSIGKSVDMVLYQGNTTELQRRSFVGEIAKDGQDLVCDLLFDDSTLSELIAGQDYYLAFSPNEADTNFNVRTIEVNSSFELTALPGATPFYLATRASPAAVWTPVKTQRPIVDPIIAEWEEAPVT